MSQKLGLHGVLINRSGGGSKCQCVYSSRCLLLGCTPTHREASRNFLMGGDRLPSDPATFSYLLYVVTPWAGA